MRTLVQEDKVKLLTDPPPLPRYIQIETSIFCNASCPFCPTDNVTRTPKYMDEKIFKKIVDETQGQGIVYRPFLQNEPLTDKRLPDFIRYIKEDPTARVEINSNGELLTEEMGERLIESGIDLIRFSVDGMDQETYDIARPGVDYQKLEKRLIRFSEMNRQAGSPIKLIIRMIDMDINRDQQERFRSFWSEYMDQVEIVPLYTWPWDGQIEPVLKPCLKIVEELFFNTAGDAVLCCWDHKFIAPLGNAAERTVQDIWLGEPNRTYRQLLAAGRRDKIHLCSKCNAYKNHDFEGWNGPDMSL